MPEIKNMFQKGVMNKDLDERLVPNGQYRDAMNVQVSTSESSEVGTVQNILGNTRVEDILGSGFKCVGAIADEKNNVLYWFVTSSAVDAIIEYRDDSTNQSTNTCTPILVDRNKDVLKFDENNLITGINIIDNLLFWTDDVNEPKKINIDTFKLNFTVNNYNNLSTHSDMFVNNASVGQVTEDHITVIRKRPQKAPTVVFSETSISTINILPKLNFFGAIVGSTINYSFDFTDQDFLDAYNLVDNTGQQLPNFYYTTGKEFILSLESDIGSLPYNHKVKLEVIGSGPTLPISNGWNGVNAMMTTNLVFEVKEISGSYIDEELTFNTTLVDEDKTIFEKEFIRFATRYKYEDGEYSAYSPFTTPIFLPGSFYFHPTDDPYNQGMESNAISITLQDLIPYDIPDDVIQLDILFKKERSTTIYSIDSIKPDDIVPADHWVKDDFANKVILNTDFVDGDTTNTSHVGFPYSSSGEYTITTENIYAALPENQMLRPWDNVPRKALAQEITANRVVYGNYLQNYNLKDYLGETASPWVITGKEPRQVLNNPVSFSNSVGKKSVKSLRTYYLGVVYGDKYGRETPVFTSKDASIHIPYDLDPSITFDGAANKSLRLTAKLLGNQPEWAYYYKYYIKQTTDEYYNLTMDRVYRGDEDVNLWISFPSSDRNKIQEGDYFSIKKQVDINSIVEVENKIKIIDIKNEAPDTIKYNFMSLGNGGGSAADLSALFPDVNQHPRPGVMKLLIDREAWMDNENGLDFEDAAAKSDKIAVQFSVTSGGTQQVSKRYIASAWAFDEDAGNDGQWSIQLRNPVSEEDYWTEQASGVLNSDQAFSITIMWMVEKPATEFEGRFFVKVISNAVTQQYLVPSTSDSTNFATVGVIPAVFNLADGPGVLDAGSGITGVYNTENAVFGTNTTNDSLSDSENDWIQNTDSYDSTVFNQDNQGWFIDATHFIAAQDQNGGMNANHSGKMYKGNPSISTQYVNGLEGIVSFPGGLAGTKYHTQSSRQWSSAVIPLLDGVVGGYTGPAPTFTTGQFNHDGSYHTSYATPTFMHLSFSSPSVDLQDSGGFDDIEDWLGDVNSFNPLLSGTWITQAELLTAIFSLGAFGKIKGTTIMQRVSEGGYDLTFGLWWEALSAGPVSWGNEWFYPTIGSNSTYWNALDPSDQEDCLKAFDVTYNNSSNASIVSNLMVGSKFMVNNDDQNVYTILDVNVQHLYNHTSWHPIIRRNSTGSIMSIHDNPESVAGRLQAFINRFGSGSQANTQSTSEWNLLKQAIINFGKADNRRTCYILTLDKDPRQGSENLLDATSSAHKTIKFIDNYIEPGANTLPTSPAIFETEAKESVDLNIYYEASDALPVGLDDDVSSLKGHLLGPIGSKVTCSLANSLVDYDIPNDAFPNNDFHLRVSDWEGRIVNLNNPGLKTNPAGQVTATSNDQTGWNAQTIIYEGNSLMFWREDGSYTTAKINEVVEISNSGNYITKVLLSPENYKHKVGLPYYNCFSFGNGVESNRIRDDFNESFILNGVRASTILEEPYEEERRKYGLIYSGLYNSTSGVNNLNQFIQAEKITKDLMPSYGSIQKLYARDKDLITLCEDKIIRVYVDKDILYNADGNSQLLATNRVLGTAEPFRGNYGVSKNPESFAAESFRAYFTDKQRGAVLRLSMDGLTPISDAGMHDFFRDNLRDGGRLYGNYDIHKGDYNLSIYFEDGESNVLNPEFEEGFSEQAQAGSEILTNNDFSGYTGNPASVVTQPSRNWVTGGGQQFYTTYIDLDDSTGVEVGMSVITITGNNSTGPLAGMSPYSIIIPMNTTTVATISTGGGSGGSDRLTLSNTLFGTSGTSTLGALSSFDVTFEKVSTVQVDDWTSTSAIFNIDLINGNTITISPIGDIGQAVSSGGGSSLVIDSNKEYRVEANVTNVSGKPTLLVGGTQITLGGDPILGIGMISEVVTFPQDINSGDSVWFTIPPWSLSGTITLTNISIKELTPYGGNVTHWDLNGGSNTSNIYTYQTSTGDEKIAFDWAPLDTYLHQNLTYTNRVLDFDKGTKCNVSFNLTDYTVGDLTFRLYNSDGDGFEQTFNSGGNHIFSGVIGDTTSTDINVIDKFGFYVSGSGVFIGNIDDVSIVLDGEGTGKTISFNEKSKGWTSFKSFVPEFGLSCVNQYYTMNLGQLWKHHTNETRNTFYDEFTESSITPILNMQPAVVKNFNTLNYEGSQSKWDQHLTDSDYYNLYEDVDALGGGLGYIAGWYVSDIHTDKQEGTLNEFIEKEGKWFNYIKGTPGQVDTAAFNFQGLGIIQDIEIAPVFGCTIPTATNFDPLANTNDGSCGFGPGAFEMQIRDLTSPISVNGAARVVYTGTNIEATGFNYAWSNGQLTSEVTGLGMGPIGLTLADGQGNAHGVMHPTTPANFVAANIVSGCTDPSATNFNYSANTDDGTCTI